MKTKVIFLIGCIFIISSCNKAPSNLLVNASFEKFDTSGRANSWSTSVHAGEPAYKFDIDTDIKFKGEASFKIEQYKKQGFGLVAQQVPLPQIDLNKIILTAKVLTKDIAEGNGLQLMVNFQTDDGFIIDQVRSESIIGSNDWVTISLMNTIPKGTTNMTVGLMLRTVGIAWIDNVTLLLE